MARRERHPYVEERFAEQLEMVRPSREGVTVPAMPRGYALRCFRDGDERAYEELFETAWPDKGTLTHTRKHALPGGFFVVEHEASRVLVSSCVAFEPESPQRHPHDGSLGWLVTDPVHAGRGLGTLVAASVTNRVVEAAYTLPWLGTEDDRLVAIGLYLRLGWAPHLYTHGMEARWRAIFERLDRQFDLRSCVAG
jgi:mycothiol synthase